MLVRARDIDRDAKLDVDKKGEFEETPCPFSETGCVNWS